MKTALKLLDKRIMVTRPAAQSEKLCPLISINGGDVILFPTIEIKEVSKTDELKNCFNDIENYDYMIFISRNAVTTAFKSYLTNIKFPERLKFIAIGPGTGNILNETGIPDVIIPENRYDSESLLQLSILHEENVREKNILIVKGIGGRNLIEDTLTQRGANISCAEIYERCIPTYNDDAIDEIWQDNKPDIIIVTSNDGLDNLVTLTHDHWKTSLFNTPLVTMSDRMITLAKERGFVSGLAIAPDKTDEGLLSALLELVEMEHNDK